MKLKILFMGTPDFSVFSLQRLFDSGESIIGVVTQQDKPSGRGYNLTPSPVKLWAQERGIPVYQPKTLKDEAFSELLAEIAPDMIVVAAFGKILPESVINYPKYGCINVHGSYLPKYRGAAPMQRAIINGESFTGVTIMDMDVGLDTGAMLARQRVKIEEDDNFETIHDKIGSIGAELLIKTIDRIKSGSVKRIKQYSKYSSYAEKIEKSECAVNFGMPARRVFDLVRGLSPMPLAYTHSADGKLIKLVAVKLSKAEKKDAKPGEVISAGNDGITVACLDSCIDIIELIPEGKRKMQAGDFVRGRGIAVGDILGESKS